MMTKLTYGNDFTIRIEVVKPQYTLNGTIYEDFDLTTCKNVKVNLVCEKHKVVIPLDWKLEENEDNIILADIIGKQLHIGAVYDVEVTGLNDEDKEWRYKTKSLFCIVDATKDSLMDAHLMDEPLELRAEITLFAKLIPVIGPQGAQGNKGQDGTFESLTPEQKEELRGHQGPQGQQGPRGEQGQAGVQGPAGQQGDKGQDGTFESLTPEQKEELRGYQGQQGTHGIAGPQGEIGQKGQDGTVKFEDLTPEQIEELRGYQGQQGTQGIAGVQGPVGEQGPDGAQGPVGAQGQEGFVPLNTILCYNEGAAVSGIKLNIVQTMPSSPDQNTIYVIL